MTCLIAAATFPLTCRCGCGQHLNSRVRAFYATIGCVGVHADALGMDHMDLLRRANTERAVMLAGMTN